MTVKLVLSIIIFLDLVLGIFIFCQNFKKPTNIMFLVMSIFAAIWTYLNYRAGLSNSVFWLQSTYASGAFVITSGLVWTWIVTKCKIKKSSIILVSVIACSLSAMSFLPDFITSDYNQVYSNVIFSGEIGWGSFMYSLFYVVIGMLILIRLIREITSTLDEQFKIQLKFVLVGAFISLVTSALTTVILPQFKIILLGAVDGIGFLIFLSFIAYSITRHKLFNIKVIAIEFVTVSLWAFILIRILMANTLHSALVECAFLGITIIFGVLLIRSTLHEIAQREKIQKLMVELQSAYGTTESENAANAKK